MGRSMQRIKTKTEDAPVVHTAEEMKNWYEFHKQEIENYAKGADASTILKDVSEGTSKRVKISAFDREALKGFLQNISSNEKNLRNLSRYLFYRSQPYARLIMYNATMFELNARSVIPNIDITKTPDKTKVLKNYYQTLKILDHMNLQLEFLKAYISCFREDVFYGVCYYDDTGFFILPMDSDYCKINRIYQTGDFGYSFNMDFFRRKEYLIDIWGEPFISMDKESKATKEKWQPMPDKYSVCLKVHLDDWETAVPVYSGLLSGVINLIDLDDIQAIADEQEIYKMLWLQLETNSNSTMADDWKVSPQLVVEYFNRMIEDALPDYVSAAVLPGKLETVSFDHDKTKDVNKIAKSTETLFNSSGGAQILNSSTISGTTAFKAAIEADTQIALSSLLPQTQAWLNRFLTYYVSHPCKVKFFPVSSYTKEDFKQTLLKDAQYSLPTKLAVNALNGFSELDTLALNFLEEEVLELHDKMKYPLSSSYTQSGDSNNGEDGRPVKEDGELTDEGEASRDKRDKAKG